jgi:tetratricopeptide (TPR) repeat protein
MTDPPKAPESEHPAPHPWLWPAAVLVPILLAYFTSFRGAFVFDDIRHIVNNELIKDLSRLPEMLASRRPVVTLSLALNHALGGLDTLGYHAFNLLIHLAAAWVLYDLVRRTLLLDRFAGSFAKSAAPIAAACALLWGVHPLTTQAVTYIIQRGESMASLAYLLVLYSLLRGATSRVSANWLALGVCACAFGLGSKAIVATAPILVLFFDRVFLSGSFLRSIRERWVFYLALFATLSLLFINGLFASIFLTKAGEQSINNIGFGMENMLPFEYAITQPGVIWHYLRLVFVPIGQVIDDRLPMVQQISPEVLIQAGLLAFAALAGLFASLKGRAWGFLLLAFFVILAPSSSIIPIRDAAYEHRMYLPLAAVIVLVVSAAYRFLPVLRSKAALAPVAVLALLLAGLTANRNLEYASRLSIWEDTLNKRPENDRALVNVAIQLVESDAEPDYPAAVEYLSRAMEIKPTTLTQRWLGIAQARAGDIAAAERSMRAALQSGFQRPFDYARFGQKLLDLNETELYDVAVLSWEQATIRRPQNAQWRLGLADAQRRSGDTASAILTTQEVSAVIPNDTSLKFILAQDLQTTGKIDLAIEQYQLVLEIDPAHIPAGIKLAELRLARQELDQARSLIELVIGFADSASDETQSVAYYLLGRIEEAAGNVNPAIAAYTTAIELNDQSLEPVINLTNLLEQNYRIDIAYKFFNSAIENVRPTDENAYLRRTLLFNYGNTLSRAGQFVDAMPMYEQAMALSPNDEGPMLGYAYAQWQAGLLEDAFDTCNAVMAFSESNGTAFTYARLIAADIAERKRAEKSTAP